MDLLEIKKRNEIASLIQVMQKVEDLDQIIISREHYTGYSTYRRGKKLNYTEHRDINEQVDLNFRFTAEQRR